MFDAYPFGRPCIPTKRRRFPDQSAVTASYAAATSGSDDVGTPAGHPETTKDLLESAGFPSQDWRLISRDADDSTRANSWTR
jgi:hypothetical protein